VSRRAGCNGGWPFSSTCPLSAASTRFLLPLPSPPPAPAPLSLSFSRFRSRSCSRSRSRSRSRSVPLPAPRGLPPVRWTPGGRWDGRAGKVQRLRQTGGRKGPTERSLRSGLAGLGRGLDRAPAHSRRRPFFYSTHQKNREGGGAAAAEEGRGGDRDCAGPLRHGRGRDERRNSRVLANGGCVRILSSTLRSLAQECQQGLLASSPGGTHGPNEAPAAECVKKSAAARVLAPLRWMPFFHNNETVVEEGRKNPLQAGGVM